LITRDTDLALTPARSATWRIVLISASWQRRYGNQKTMSPVTDTGDMN
jgi:hypothetical protein